MTAIPSEIETAAAVEFEPVLEMRGGDIGPSAEDMKILGTYCRIAVAVLGRSKPELVAGVYNQPEVFEAFMQEIADAAERLRDLAEFCEVASTRIAIALSSAAVRPGG